MGAGQVAIIGARWPDHSIECEVLGRSQDDVARDPGTSREGILSAGAEADVILAGPRAVFDADVLTQLRCRGIVRYGVGYENIDVDAANRLGIIVATVPDYGTDAVALHAVTLVLAALRRIVTADAMVKAGSWDVRALAPLHLPAALTAGVIGFGRIGRRTAEHLQALGFGRILAQDAFTQVEAPGIDSAALPELLTQCDVVSLHTPARADGMPLLGPGELELMKPGSVLVNTARGSLIDTDALIVALGRSRPAFAALDVFDSEPPDPQQYADVLDRIILTPHMAWFTEETERDLRVKTAEEAKRLLDGDAPLHPVSTNSERT